MGKLNWFAGGVVAGLMAAAISKELEKPAAARTWKGKVAGVPYNFRPTDWTSIAREYWNPASDQILMPHSIGLGWGINFAAVYKRVESLMAPQERRVHEPVER